MTGTDGARRKGNHSNEVKLQDDDVCRFSKVRMTKGWGRKKTERKGKQKNVNECFPITIVSLFILC